MSGTELPFPSCPDCGAPLAKVHHHIPGNLVREYRCGVRWLDVDDERKQAVLSGAPFPCCYIKELRASLHRCWAELATEHERNYPLPEPLREAMHDAWKMLDQPGAA